MERYGLERLWRSRVADARLRNELACNYVKEVQRDLPTDDTSPDGQYAYQRAIRLMNLALSEYNRVLHIFTDLVVDGKVPDEDE